MSALVLKRAFSLADVQFLHYNSPAHKNLEAREGMIFADFSPHRDRVEDFVKVGAIVLDHHETQRSVVAAFRNLGVYCDEPGVSGAFLALEAIYGLIPCADLLSPAILVGIYDTWQTQDPHWIEACELVLTLRFWPFEDLLKQNFLALKETVGPVLYSRNLDEARYALDNGLRLTIQGVRAVVFEGLSRTSYAAELAGTDLDLVVCFGYVVQEGVPQVIFSTRSHTNFDCAAFCKAHGGGGHLRAAGFQTSVKADPFSQFTTILEKYLRDSTGETK